MTCKCFARCEADCVCDHDWTPPAVIALREEVERLRAELICVCNLLAHRGRHAEDGKYCKICEVVARARKIAAARKGEEE